jgi:hypothetical protein
MCDSGYYFFFAAGFGAATFTAVRRGGFVAA